MEFTEDQKKINSYFEIAKSKNLNFANNIKESLQEKTNRFESALSSYSIYLQGN